MLFDPYSLHARLNRTAGAGANPPASPRPRSITRLLGRRRGLVAFIESIQEK